MHVLRGISAHTTHDDPSVVLVPFQHRPWTNAESSPYFDRNRYLSLSGEF
jgi:hypothetical protein